MSPAELIAKINQLGGRLYLDDGELRLKAPKGSLDDELRAELKRQKQGLIEFLLAAQSASSKSDIAITRVSREEAIPASFSQQRLWFLDELEPGNSIFNMPWSMRLQGKLNVDALQSAFDDLVARHESLRTCFRSDGNLPVQNISASMPILIQHETRHGASDVQINDWATEHSAVPFDLQTGPLLRVYTLETATDDHRLLIIIHHIVSDAWSMSVLFQELSVLYAAHCQGQDAQLPELTVHYADYAVWQRNWLQGKELERQVSYWRNNLADAPPLLELPTDRPRPVTQSYAGNHLQLHGSADLTRQLQQLARPLGASMFMLLQTTFNLVLARYAGTEDIIIGTPIAGRRHAELEPLIGFFLNTLVLRNDLSGNPTFTELLKRVRKTTLAAYEHQDVPFEKLVEELRPDRELSHSPVFQVLFNVRAQTEGEIGLHELNVDFDHVERNTAKVDLALSINESSEGLAIDFEYNTDLFDESTMQGFASAYLTLLEAIAEDADRAIADLPLLTEQELTQREARELAARPATTFTEFPASELEQSVVDRFEAMAALHANRLAAHTEELSWTYAELNAQANRVAQTLLETSEQDQQHRVGVLLGQNVPMLAGLLGVLKAGMAYVPLDPEAPTARHQQIVAEASLSIIVTDGQHHELANQAAGPGINVVELTTQDAGVAANPDLSIDPDWLAYILFTSGSTGTPKGVMQSHRNVLHHCRTYTNAVHIDATDRLTLLPPYGFDAAVMDIFGALLNGASLYPFDLRTEANPEAICGRIVSNQISIFHSTPTVFRYLLEQSGQLDLSTVRLVVLGGEEARSTDFELFRELFPADAVMVNGLGPSESTLALQFFARHDTRLPGMVVPVGRAVHDTEIVLLDKDGDTSGICGELAIRSRYVTPGYWNAPDLTTAVLSEADEQGRALYRTGDHARYLADGQLVYTGREDAQIKLRGHRIEVGEIEAVLVDHPTLDNAVVILRKEPDGAAQLVAYLTSAGKEAIDTGTIRDYLREKLPAYMVPAGIVCLDLLPMTASGKIDRSKLPAPLWEADTASYVAPRTPEEQALAEIWSDILHVERVGIHDDFFALGGHSLLATQVIARVRDSLDTELPLRAIFETPNVEGLAATITADAGNMSTIRIPIGERSEYPPQSFAQQRLWFLDRLEPGSSVYNLSQSVQLDGPLDIQALQNAVDDLVKRHESLRTTFADSNNDPVQIIAQSLHIPLRFTDLPDADDSRLQAKLTELVNQPFDLAEGPLLRLHMLKLGNDRHVLLLMIHHIVSDAWSLNVLWQDLTRLYNAHCRNKPAGLQALAVQYADYAAWQRDWLAGDELEHQIAYWKTRLDGMPALLELPTDRPRPTVMTHNGAHVAWSLAGETPATLKKLATERGSTLFMVLLAAFSALLSRYSGHDDIVVGSPIAGRRHTDLEGLIGFFVNTLILRTDLSDNPNFYELLERVKHGTLEAYEHQDLPFEKLVEELQPARDMSHTPLFQVAFILQNAPGRPAAFDRLEANGLPVHHGHSKFDMTLALWENTDGLGGVFEFNTDLFDRETIERMADQFRALLNGIAENPNQCITEIPLISAAERHQLLVEWNDTTTDYPRNATIQELFESQVTKTPDHIAVICADRSLTYEALNRRANQLAHYLREHGVEPDTLVGICMDREIDTVIAILGILKAGGAYVPLDPSYPAERLQFMLEDTRAPAVLSLSHMDLKSGSSLRIDLDRVSLKELPDTNPDCTTTGNNLAYVIFTSGSTGRAKGTLIDNRCVLRLVINTDYADFSDRSRIAMLAPISFDASTFELWGSLLHGGQLIIFPDRVPSIDALGEFLQANEIDFVFLTSALFNTIIDASPQILRSVRQLLTGGEALSVPHINRAIELLPDTQLSNVYGPTESTTFTTAFRIPRPLPDDWYHIPIGKPIANTTVYILDHRLQPVPTGVSGELYIGGDGLSRGYLNQPELTVERFIPDPFSNSDNARLYKTGDLVRHLPDGNIEFIGRGDNQIKLRGFRIELGEIEAALCRHPAIKKAAVILHQRNDGDKRLIAYAVADADLDDSANHIQHYLGEHIPKYMVPTTYILVDDIPLTANGKLDRKALPDPDAQLQSACNPDAKPVTFAERSVAEIWCRLLGVDAIGLDDDFFDLGGHSLLTIKLLKEIEDMTGERLSIADVFDNPTIGEFSPLLENAAWAEAQTPKPTGLARLWGLLTRRA
jgi:amino acid adenylation domain-containing protein